MSNERVKAYEAIRAFLFDLDSSAPIIEDKVLDVHLGSGLSHLDKWRPLRLVATLVMDPTTYLYNLPADFIEIELESFNSAVNPSRLAYNWSGYQYELGFPGSAMSRPMGVSSSPFGLFNPPYSGSQSLSFGIIFLPGTRFEFANNPDGSKTMLTSPMPSKPGDLKFLYHARHLITDDDSTQTPAVVGGNTVAIEDRRILWAKVGQLACYSLARKTAANRFTSRTFLNLAKECESEFNSDTRQAFTWAG